VCFSVYVCMRALCRVYECECFVVGMRDLMVMCMYVLSVRACIDDDDGVCCG